MLHVYLLCLENEVLCLLLLGPRLARFFAVSNANTVAMAEALACLACKCRFMWVGGSYMDFALYFLGWLFSF